MHIRLPLLIGALGLAGPALARVESPPHVTQQVIKQLPLPPRIKTSAGRVLKDARDIDKRVKEGSVLRTRLYGSSSLEVTGGSYHHPESKVQLDKQNIPNRTNVELHFHTRRVDGQRWLRRAVVRTKDGGFIETAQYWTNKFGSKEREFISEVNYRLDAKGRRIEKLSVGRAILLQ